MFYNQVKNQNTKMKNMKKLNKTQQTLTVGHIVTDDQMKTLPQTPPVGKRCWFGCSRAPDRDTARMENEGMALTLKH